MIACGDDVEVKILKDTDKIMTYGFEPTNHVVATNVIKSSAGTTFDVLINGEFYHTFHTPFFGDHMILNSLAVISICYLEGLNQETIESDLCSFEGVKRRFAQKNYRDQIIIDDYAHHPTEIAATLKAVRQKYPDRDLVAVFQPHTFTRTAAFIDEFAQSLNLADYIYLTEIFGSAREESGAVNIQTLIDKCHSGHLITKETVNQLEQYPTAVIVFMGAGDIKKYEDAYTTLTPSI